MDNTVVLERANEDFVKAQDLAILVLNRRVILSRVETFECYRILKKWISYFDDKAKTTPSQKNRRNYLYLRNRFKGYYKSLT